MVRMLWLQAGISEQQSRFNSSHHWGGRHWRLCRFEPHIRFRTRVPDARHREGGYIMNCNSRNVLGFLLAMATIALIAAGNPAVAATAEDLNRDARQALEKLTSTNTLAETLSAEAKAILVFPNIVKAGLVFGGSYGEGVLIKDSEVVDYYNSVAGTFGFQAGAQSYAYIMFLMTDEAVSYLETSKGWEVGVGPTVVLVDEGVAKNLSTSSLKEDAYAFIFSQQGLMAGISIEGTKISRIQR